MWVLTLVNAPKVEIFYITTRKAEFLVGRANADIILSGDSSISRKHSSFYIANRDQCPFETKTRTGLWVKDHGSKYGTYLNAEEGQDWVKIDPNVNKPVPHGSYLRFGIISNTWRVEYKPLLICPSTLPEPLTSELKEKVVALDGMLTAQFHHKCALVVTPKLSLSLKVLLALVHGVPIVTPSYMDEVASAVKNCTKWPDVKPFLPNLAEVAVKKSDANLNHEQNRKELFSGLTFYVGKPEQLESLKLVVESAGGKICLFNGDNPERLLADGAVLLEPRPMSSQTQSQSQWDAAVTGLLEKKGRRAVPEREIPLAIVYASVAKHCNPAFMDFTPKLHPANSETPHLTPSTVIEEDTEPPTNVQNISNRVVQASLSQQGNPSDAKSHAHDSVFLVDALGSAGSHTATVTTQLLSKEKRPGPTKAPSVSTSGQPTKTNSTFLKSKETSVSFAKPSPMETAPSLAKSIQSPTCSSIPDFAVPAQKRCGSLDIFDDERPNKRLSSDPPSSVEKIASKGTWFSDSNKPSTAASSSSHSRRSPSPPQATERRKKGSENPFGANLASSTPYSVGKRPLEDSEPTEQPDKRKRLQDVTPIQRKRLQNVAPVLSRPDLIPRPLVKPTVIEKALPEANELGFIDMSFKKENPEEALAKTVIMMSMINIERLEARHIEAANDAVPNGVRNVKVFRKQTVLSPYRRIPLESLEAPSLENNWPSCST